MLVNKKKCMISLKKKKETGMLDSSGIYARLHTALECPAVLIASGGNSFEFVCGILCVHSDKSTILAVKIKQIFPDFHCHIQFFKGWGPICCFFATRDFLAFGCYSQELIIQMAHNSSRHKKLLSESRIKGNLFSLKNCSNARTRWVWYVIKRSIVASIIYNILRIIFDKVVYPYLETAEIPTLTAFFEYLFRIIFGSCNEEEPAPPEPEPHSNLQVLSFVAVAVLTLILSHWVHRH